MWDAGGMIAVACESHSSATHLLVVDNHSGERLNADDLGVREPSWPITATARHRRQLIPVRVRLEDC